MSKPIRTSEAAYWAIDEALGAVEACQAADRSGRVPLPATVTKALAEAQMALSKASDELEALRRKL